MRYLHRFGPSGPHTCFAQRIHCRSHRLPPARRASIVEKKGVNAGDQPVLDQGDIDAAHHRLLMADSGLSGSDYPVLVTLYERGDHTVRSTELADLIGWEQSRLSHHLARMERRGLIRRITHKADNRVAEVHLTDQGRDIYLGATIAHSQAVRTHFADVLTVQQIEALIEAMDALRRHLDR
jgi:DNA-binding MarR family transcriptional regulator